jgi:hypothetical protein
LLIRGPDGQDEEDRINTYYPATLSVHEVYPPNPSVRTKERGRNYQRQKALAYKIEEDCRLHFLQDGPTEETSAGKDEFAQVMRPSLKKTSELC